MKTSDFLIKISKSIDYDGTLKKGDKIGILNVFINDELVEQTEILANENIKRSNIFSRLFKSLNYLVWGDV